MNMAKIKVVRTPEWVNSARKFRVYLDGQKIGTISNGEIKEFDVPIGQHKLQAKIDWCGSNKLPCTIKENKIDTVTVSGFKSGIYLFYVLGGLFGLHFIFKFVFDIDFLILLAIPAVFIIIYYLTIGRNSYLQIKKDDSSDAFPKV
jgi:hypothetical protein